MLLTCFLLFHLTLPRQYDKKYRKNHKVQLSIDLNPEEKIELINLIKANGFKSTREFLLKSIDIIKSDKNPFSKK